MRVIVCQPIKHWETDEYVGKVKIHVCFGKERRKISGYIACDVGGMSHDACLLALNRWFEIVENRLGWALNDLVLKTVEFNKDYHGRRIDGIQCVTKKDLYGIIDRTYQKEEDIIRKERKLTQPMSINKFEAEIQRGLHEIGRSQEHIELRKDVNGLTEAIKFTNSRLLDHDRLLEAMYKRLLKLNQPNNTAKMDALSAGIERLNAALDKLGVIGEPEKIVEGQRKLGKYTV